MSLKIALGNYPEGSRLRRSPNIGRRKAQLERVEGNYEIDI
jgi:hypothetical protein